VSDAPALALTSASRRYEGEAYALHDVTLDVRSGEWIAVTGPSGSGKSTLLNLMGGLDLATSGSCRILGQDWALLTDGDRARMRRENVGFVFQQFHLIPYLTAVENVMLAQHFHSLADRPEALRALADVGLEPLATRLPKQLSGGERQRVCIARALINRPRVILADEPTGNLDEENENAVTRLLGELHRAGHTLVVVTHDPEVAALAQHHVRLAHGRIAQEEHR